MFTSVLDGIERRRADCALHNVSCAPFCRSADCLCRPLATASPDNPAPPIISPDQSRPCGDGHRPGNQRPSCASAAFAIQAGQTRVWCASSDQFLGQPGCLTISLVQPNRAECTVPVGYCNPFHQFLLGRAWGQGGGRSRLKWRPPRQKPSSPGAAFPDRRSHRHKSRRHRLERFNPFRRL